MERSASPAGIVLAGGLSRRMGVDKAFVELDGQTLIERAIARLAPQVGALAISANADPDRFRFTGLPVLADTVAGRPGPLAGILAGMRWAERATAARSIVTVPVDAPFFPTDIVLRLAGAAAGGVAVAASDDRLQPVFACFPIALADDLTAFLRSEGRRAVIDWLATQPHAVVTFPHAPDEPDPFFNINGPDDLATASAILDDGRLPAPRI